MTDLEKKIEKIFEEHEYKDVYNVFNKVEKLYLRKEFKKQGRVYETLDELKEKEFSGKEVIIWKLEKSNIEYHNTNIMFGVKEDNEFVQDYYFCSDCKYVKGEAIKKEFDASPSLTLNLERKLYCIICKNQIPTF